MATQAEVEQATASAVAATRNMSPEVQAAAVSAAIGAIPPPSGKDAIWLWKALVSGLIVLLVIAMVGVIYTVVDANNATSPDVIVTLFTAVLTGLIGLFVRSPMQGG